MTAGTGGGMAKTRFGQLIRRCNPDQPLREIAERNNVSVQSIQYWMRPDRRRGVPTFQKGQQLARWVGCDAREMFIALTLDFLDHIGAQLDVGVSEQEWRFLERIRSLGRAEQAAVYAGVLAAVETLVRADTRPDAPR